MGRVAAVQAVELNKLPVADAARARAPTQARAAGGPERTAAARRRRARREAYASPGPVRRDVPTRVQPSAKARGSATARDARERIARVRARRRARGARARVATGDRRRRVPRRRRRRRRCARERGGRGAGVRETPLGVESRRPSRLAAGCGGSSGGRGGREHARGLLDRRRGRPGAARTAAAATYYRIVTAYPTAARVAPPSGRRVGDPMVGNVTARLTLPARARPRVGVLAAARRRCWWRARQHTTERAALRRRRRRRPSRSSRR